MVTFATERIYDLLIRDNCLTSDFFSGGHSEPGFGCPFFFSSGYLPLKKSKNESKQ